VIGTVERREPHRILVLLPVYNGGAHLVPQLDSILHQQGVEPFLLCRDDGSQDDSLAVLKDYAQRYPSQIELLSDDRGNLGASGSFSLLMETAGVLLEDRALHFVALADQDDLWHAERLWRGVEQLLVLEQKAPGMPALVHSDLRVVTESGEVIAPSLIAYQGLDPGRVRLRDQLLSNTVTGCTAVMNAALLHKALPIPPQAIMHDWWLSLVASAFGHRCFVDEALVDYRQHGTNAIGAKKWQPASSIRTLRQRLFDESSRDDFYAIADQAKVFRQRYAAELSCWNHLILLCIGGLSVRSVPLQRLLFRVLRKV